ncbi:uroporphyrinogen-III C-methyltransferase [soil metagenome]
MSVIFVSAGPGAADLITLRGAKALAAADVVLFDALTDPALRELAPNAQWLDVGKRGFAHATKQTAINALLVKMALAHRNVVRLKGGDASVFGRLEEELLALAAAGISCEVIPGVTAASAAAALTQRPLTRRGSGRSVSLTTAMTQDGSLTAQRSADTEVFYMAGKQLAALSRKLVEAGWPADTPVCVTSNAGAADALSSDHPVSGLASASMLHRGRPTVVAVGAGASKLKKVTQAPSKTTGTQALAVPATTSD